MQTDGDQWIARSWGVVLSVACFGVYLGLSGLVLVISPNTLLTIFGFSPAREVWIRVAGVIVVAVSVYYFQAVRTRSRALMEATVAARSVGAVGLMALGVLGLTEPVIVAFGLIDAGSAAWTGLALRRAATAGHART